MKLRLVKPTTAKARIVISRAVKGEHLVLEVSCGQARITLLADAVEILDLVEKGKRTCIPSETEQTP